MSSEKRKIAYIDGKPYEIGPNHTSILKFVKSYLGEKKVPTLCDDPNLAPYGARFGSSQSVGTFFSPT